MALADLYLPTDLEAAAVLWQANCGPGALAALLGIEVYDTQAWLGGDQWPGWTTMTVMKAALTKAGRQFRVARPAVMEQQQYDLAWTLGHQGLAFVQLEGPWERHWAGAQRHTHWIAWRGPHVYDVNLTTDAGRNYLAGGWASLDTWRQLVPQYLAEDEPHMTGWHWRSALVVE